MIRIEEEKCNRCGWCVKECVSGVLQIRSERVEAVEPSWCNRCSHCVAVCPTGAVVNEGLSGDPARLIAKDRLDPAAYREIVMTRRSVRWYQPGPLPREELQDLLDLARYSPTASNTMDVGYIVITDRDQIKKIGEKVFHLVVRIGSHLEKPWGRLLFWFYQHVSGNRNLGLYLERLALYEEWTKNGRNLITHNAPALVILHGPEHERFARENCAIAATNLVNYAHAKGLGTCYIGFLVMALSKSKKFRAGLGVPPGRQGYMVLTLGRPVHQYRNTPIRPEAPVSWR